MSLLDEKKDKTRSTITLFDTDRDKLIEVYGSLQKAINALVLVFLEDQED